MRNAAETEIDNNELISDFNNLDWQQVYIQYTEMFTALYVDELMCTIEGERKVATVYNENFYPTHLSRLLSSLLHVGVVDDNRDLSAETVFPPRPPLVPQNPDLLDKYQLMLIGGIIDPTLGHKHIKSGSYFSKLPPFNGCIRGLRVGDGQPIVDIFNDAELSPPDKTSKREKQ